MHAETCACHKRSSMQAGGAHTTLHSLGSLVCAVLRWLQRGAEDGSACQAFAPRRQGSAVTCPSVPHAQRQRSSTLSHALLLICASRCIPLHSRRRSAATAAPGRSGAATARTDAAPALVSTSSSSARAVRALQRPPLPRLRLFRRRRCSSALPPPSRPSRSSSARPSSRCGRRGVTEPPSRARSPCSVKTVGHWIRRWEKEHAVREKPRTGRKRKAAELTPAIVAAARQQPITTPRDIRRREQLPLSSRTVRRRLNEAGLYGRVALREHPYTREHLRKRLSFAEGYGKWTAAEWDRVLFTDESRVEMGPHGRVWVQRVTGGSERERGVGYRGVCVCVRCMIRTSVGTKSAKRAGASEQRAVGIGQSQTVRYCPIPSDTVSSRS